MDISAAIVLHLVDTHPMAGLAPAIGTPERAHFYKWLIWMTNSLQAAMVQYFYPERSVDDGNEAGARQVRIALDQVQTDGSLFTMPLEVAVHAKGQAVPAIHRVQVNARANVFTIDVASEPADVRLDPNFLVLMEASFERERGR